MEASQAMTLLESYDLLLVIAGLAVLAAAVLPHLLSDKPLSLPMVLLGLGFAVFALPLGLEAPDPLEHGEIEMEARIICPVVDGGWVEVLNLTEDGRVEKVRHEGDSPEAERMRKEAVGRGPAF